MTQLTALPRTLELLGLCWQEAEVETRRLIAERYTVHDEVFINRLFYGELSSRFRSANAENEFASAVFLDLRHLAATQSLLDSARLITRSLVARVSYHEPHEERRTGADLGLTVVRPTFSVARNGLEFKGKLHDQGLLCQAKRQSRRGTWGAFTESQKRILPRHLEYLGLLLFAYSDSNRHQLFPFVWRSCAGHPFEEVQQWLNDREQTGLTSEDLIYDLGNGRLGTDDEHIVRNVICASQTTPLTADTSSLRVEVTWADGPPDDPDDMPPSGASHLDSELKNIRRRQHEAMSRHRDSHRHTPPPPPPPPPKRRHA